MARYGIIGTGNIGLALITGMVDYAKIPSSDIIVYDADADKLKQLQSNGFLVAKNNKEVVKNASIVFLAVKPFLIEAVVKEICLELTDKSLLVSIAAGVSSKDIISYSGGKGGLILCMPNTGMAVGQSVTFLSEISNPLKNTPDLVQLFSKFGICLLVDEKQMAAATVMGGCGTAFGLRFIRAITEAGVEMGFKPADAQIVAAQILKAAGAIATQEGAHPESELDKVTTPGGITITALNEMEHNGFSSSIIKGLNKAFQKLNK